MVFIRDCGGCGVTGHRCGAELPDLGVIHDKPYFRLLNIYLFGFILSIVCAPVTHAWAVWLLFGWQHSPIVA